MPNFIFPSKAFNYLQRLALNYEHAGPKPLAQIIKHGHIAIEEEADRSYDFGQDFYGHNVIVFLPPNIIGPITISQQTLMTQRLRDDLAECAKGISNEYVHTVRFELIDENDPLYQSSQMLSGKPPINPDNLSFWKPGQIRIFVSHRDTHKAGAHALADALQQFGISCFVAHDTIEPTKDWQREIEKALDTMEIFLALVTPDFHDRVWTDQEVGIAKARNVPMISIKLGAVPRGFIAEKQAIQGVEGHPERSAHAIYKVIRDNIKQGGRMQGALITAFCETPDFAEAQIRFDLMNKLVEKLSETELQQIKDAFEKNEKLHNAFYLTNQHQRLLKFLTRTTDQKFKFDKVKIVSEAEELDEEIPF
jgi:hypothetical protein